VDQVDTLIARAAIRFAAIGIRNFLRTGRQDHWPLLPPAVVDSRGGHAGIDSHANRHHEFEARL
jgi:hypothetical protein